MGLMLSASGKLMVRPSGKLFVDTNGTDCCCGDDAGCCPGILIPTSGDGLTPGTVLEIEIVSDGTGCFAPGTKQEMKDLASPGIWESWTAGAPDRFMANAAFRNLTLSCIGDTELRVTWGSEAGCPITPVTIWTQTSGSCSPFEFRFSNTLSEDDFTGCTDCAGTIGG